METTQVKLQVPRIFLEQYSKKYLEDLLCAAATTYEGWGGSGNPPRECSVMVALRESLTMVTQKAETLESIDDTSPADYMFENSLAKIGWDETLERCAHEIIDNNEMYTEDYETEYAIMEDITSEIIKYVDSTEGCFHDNFYQLYFNDFTEQYLMKIQSESLLD
jgi:hypothetical protein